MSDTFDPIGARGRKYRRRQKLGDAASCAMCGITDPTVLMKTDRAFFEEHHVLGQAHVPHLTITVCRNCHARLSAAQTNDAVPLKRQSTLLQRLIAIVLALASLLKALGEELLTWATKADRFTSGLDATFPEWRTYEWAA